jgi:hypothetical protein
VNSKQRSLPQFRRQRPLPISPPLRRFTSPPPHPYPSRNRIPRCTFLSPRSPLPASKFHRHSNRKPRRRFPSLRKCPSPRPNRSRRFQHQPHTSRRYLWRRQSFRPQHRHPFPRPSHLLLPHHQRLFRLPQYHTCSQCPRRLISLRPRPPPRVFPRHLRSRLFALPLPGPR